MSFGYVAAATIGSAVLGYSASRSATRAASSAAEASNATAQEAAQLQYDLGKETLDFNRQYYNEVVKPTADFDLQSRREMTPILTQALREQTDFSRQQRDDYLNNWRPVEQRVRQDAMGYDSDENVNRRMGIAAANVNQQYSNAQGQQARALTRYGINPNSSAFARANANLVNQQALTAAGAQTGAAFDTQDRAIALRAGAANFGRNMPNTSATFGQLGNQTAGTTNATTAGGVSVANAAGNFMNQGYGLAGSLNASGAGIDNSIFRNNLALADMQARGVGQLFSGIGQGFGMFGKSGGFGNTGFGGLNLGTALQYGTTPGSQQTSMLAAQEFGMANGGHVGDAVQRLADGGQPAGSMYGVEERRPYDGELAYFRSNPHVAGMAAEDGRIVMNPFSRLSPEEANAVRMNEAARVRMRGNEPGFDLTPEQSRYLDSTEYKGASDADRRATIAARILSGDPSAGQPTRQQLDYVRSLRGQMDPRRGLADGGMPDGGGLVHGPGGPRDDMVPVRLSKNEFVLNEGAVRHFGLDKLNKMNAVGLENQARRGLLRSA